MNLTPGVVRSMGQKAQKSCNIKLKSKLTHRNDILQRKVCFFEFVEFGLYLCPETTKAMMPKRKSLLQLSKRNLMLGMEPQRGIHHDLPIMTRP